MFRQSAWRSLMRTLEVVMIDEQTDPSPGIFQVQEHRSL